jgi:hypothetical protein
MKRGGGGGGGGKGFNSLNEIDNNVFCLTFFCFVYCSHFATRYI